MRVTIDVEEELIEPLMQNHLETGIAVKKQIADAISFYQKCTDEVKKGSCIIAGSLRGNYISNQKHLMGKEIE